MFTAGRDLLLSSEYSEYLRARSLESKWMAFYRDHNLYRDVWASVRSAGEMRTAKRSHHTITEG